MIKKRHVPPKISIPKKIALVFLGIFFAFIIIECGLRIGGGVLLFRQESRNVSSFGNEDTYRILCIGESHTYWGGEYSYPRQLERILNERSKKMSFNVINKGIPTITSASILKNLEGYLNKYDPHMVIAMMGSTDTEYATKDINVYLVTFFESFKTFKLLGYLKAHIIEKLNKKNISEEIFNIDNLMTDSLKEETLKRNITKNPKDLSGYEALGDYYFLRDPEEAEKVFKKNIEINSDKSAAYLALGEFYAVYGRHAEAETVLVKAVEINPNEYEAYIVLGESFLSRKNFDGAKANFIKAMEVNPKRHLAEQLLGCLYWNQGDYEKAEEVLFQAIEKKTKFLDEDNEFFYSCNWDIGAFNRAERILKNAIDKDSTNSFMYGLLASLYQKHGYRELADEYYQKADEIRYHFVNPVTQMSYNQLKLILDERKIKLVCVQYPMRSAESLKKMLTNKEGVIFVDNRDIFIEAVTRNGYGKYFVDMISGDFGHCTMEGCRLLAENIADTILPIINNAIRHDHVGLN